MQFHKGDKAAAAKSFAAALALQPGLALNPDYDTPDLHAAWDSAQGGGSGGAGGAGGGAPEGDKPSGDFSHTPATEQKANTPLPLYARVPEDMKVVRALL